MKRSYTAIKGAEYLLISAPDIIGRHMAGDSTLAEVKEMVGIHPDAVIRIETRHNDGSVTYRQQGTTYRFNIKPVGGNYPL